MITNETSSGNANGATNGWRNGTKEHLHVVIACHIHLWQYFQSQKSSIYNVQVGGSLGGLMADLVLKALGHNTTISERNPSPLLQNQGAGIVAGGDTLAFFKHNKCKRPTAVTSQKRTHLDKSGKAVREENVKQNMISWDLSYYLLRANFDSVKNGHRQVPKKEEGGGVARYEYGHVVTGPEEGEEAGVLYFEHSGTVGTVGADLVIGADRPSSTVRKMFHPEVQRKLVGCCALRRTAREDEASASAKEAFQERFTFFHADGIQILAYLIPGTNGY